MALMGEFDNASDPFDLPLDPGEHLLWKGRPPSGVMLRSQDAFLIPFSILWCGFAIFWEATAANATRRTPGFFLVWGAAFVAIGLYFVFGRFIVDAVARARTFYGLTDQRVLIVSGFTTRNVQSLVLSGLADVELQERRGGKGSILFGRSPGYGNVWGRGFPGSGRNMPPAFEGIENARQVYDMIRRAQKAAV